VVSGTALHYESFEVGCVLTFSAASSNFRLKTSLRSHSPSSWAFLLYSGKFLFNTRKWRPSTECLAIVYSSR
jgi:hypothetical protein